MDAKGQGYRVNSDVWSLGLTLLEVALNRYPYQEANEEPLGPIELINMITLSKPPELEDEPEIGLKWSSGIKAFVKKCLDRDPATRPSPSQLLEDSWVKKTSHKFPSNRLAVWLAQVWEWEMPSVTSPPPQTKPLRLKKKPSQVPQQPTSANSANSATSSRSSQAQTPHHYYQDKKIYYNLND